MLDYVVAAANAARLDTTIAATLTVAELLAALRVHAAAEPEDIVAQFRHLVLRRAMEMSEDREDPFTDATDPAGTGRRLLNA